MPSKLDILKRGEELAEGYCSNDFNSTGKCSRRGHEEGFEAAVELLFPLVGLLKCNYPCKTLLGDVRTVKNKPMEYCDVCLALAELRAKVDNNGVLNVTKK